MTGNSDFTKELEELINRHGVDSECETPDFILASLVDGWLVAYREAMQKNIFWHSGWHYGLEGQASK